MVTILILLTKSITQYNYRATLIDGFIEKKIRIKFFNTIKFEITEAFFGGYNITVFRNFKNSVAEISIKQEYDVPRIIEELICGEIELAKKLIEINIIDYQAITSQEDIQELYDDQEGQNEHDSNVLLLAVKFGTPADVESVREEIIYNQIAGYSAYTENIDAVHEKLSKNIN